MELDYWIFHQGHDYRRAFDDAMRDNYINDNFDKNFVEKTNYIIGITDDRTDYIISACSSECKDVIHHCYECRTGYAIYGK
jgi:hypothetical protein